MSHFDYIETMFGPARAKAEISQPDIDALQGWVPDALLQFWEKEGAGIYGDGLLHLCNPLLYKGLIEVMFEEDSEINAADTVLYAFTPFGQLYLWNRNHGPVKAYLIDGGVGASGILKPQNRKEPEIELAGALFSFSPERADLSDAEGQPLYVRASKALGQPALDECFGFFPALALGGERRLENLQRVKALEHFIILAQAGGLELKDYSKLPAQTIRPIGT